MRFNNSHLLNQNEKTAVKRAFILLWISLNIFAAFKYISLASQIWPKDGDYQGAFGDGFIWLAAPFPFLATFILVNLILFIGNYKSKINKFTLLIRLLITMWIFLFIYDIFHYFEH